MEGAPTGDHPVRRGILRDIDEMEKLVDNLFNFELAAYAGAHTPVSGHRCIYSSATTSGTSNRSCIASFTQMR